MKGACRNVSVTPWVTVSLTGKSTTGSQHAPTLGVRGLGPSGVPEDWTPSGGRPPISQHPPPALPRGLSLLTDARARLRGTPARGRVALRAGRGRRVQNSPLESCALASCRGPLHTRCPGPCDQRSQTTLSVSRGSRGQPSLLLTLTGRPALNRTEHKDTVPFQTPRLSAWAQRTEGVSGLTRRPI